MPLPKSLRRPVRRASSSSSSFTAQPQRKKCRVCNNLDPRGHISSISLNESTKDSKVVLSLVLDALNLAKTKDVAHGGCRFCNILLVVLDTFFEKWRGSRVRINVDLKEKAPVKVSIDGEKWKNEVAEIYAGSGRFFSSFSRSNGPGLAISLASILVYRLLLTEKSTLKMRFLVVGPRLTNCSFKIPLAHPWHHSSYSGRFWLR